MGVNDLRKIKDNKPLLKLLSIVTLIFLCCNLPSLTLCLAKDLFPPPNTEVLVSACKYPIATGVPDGEVLFLHEVRTGKMYLLDLRTGEKRTTPNDPLLLEKGIFLSSDLVWLEGSLVRPDKPGYRPHYILDLTDGKRYELLDLDTLPRLEGGKFDPKNYAYIQSAQYIYIHHSKNTLVALSADFRTNPNSRVVFSDSAEELVQLIKNLNMNYELIDFRLYDTDIPSPTNKHVARFDGIYLTQTNQRITSGMYNYFKGWYYDDSAIIVQDGGDYLLTFPGLSSIFMYQVQF
ncbi:MAG: hypothetical protein UZ14_CFX002003207 [Chloroflexi bacterium OLB14]|nr:MAG: hypothetical protein UZ14_CFX002003207 [Chloroflexi bacterium OLB14]